MSWLYEMHLNGPMLPNHLKSLTLTYATTSISVKSLSRAAQVLLWHYLNNQLVAPSLGLTDIADHRDNRPDRSLPKSVVLHTHYRAY